MPKQCIPCVFKFCETRDLCQETHVLLLSKPMICEEVQALLSSIHEDGDHNLTIRYRLQKCTNNMILRMILGNKMEKLTTSKENSRPLMESITKAVEYLGMLNIGDYIPSLAWMDLQVSIVIEVYEYILRTEYYLE